MGGPAQYCIVRVRKKCEKKLEISGLTGLDWIGLEPLLAFRVCQATGPEVRAAVWAQTLSRQVVSDSVLA